MSDWFSEKTSYGYKLNIHPTDSESALAVEYHEDHDLFYIETVHYPQHDPGDHSDWNHEETRVRVDLCGRNLQVFLDFFEEHCKGKGFWSKS